MKTLPTLCLGIATLIIVGCGQSFSGNYTVEVRLVEGESETEKYPLQATREKHAKYGEKTLALNSGGRYVLNTGNRIHEGDWWVADNNRIAIRCDTQGGQRMAKGLISEDADSYYHIRANGDLSRVYNNSESNLEVVFTKH